MATIISHSKGFFLPLLAAVLVVLLSIVGLTIDTGYVYRTKIRLQNSVDAATLAGAKRLLEDPATDPSASVEQSSEELVRENLRLMGFAGGLIDSSPFVVDATVSPDRRQIVVDAALTQPTLLLGALPGFSKFVTVTAKSTASNRQLAVSLVIDRSASMNSGGKLQGAKDAAKLFVDYLLPTDQLSIVTYSQDRGDDAIEPDPYDFVLGAPHLDARIDIALAPVGDAANRNIIKNTIQAIVASESTNIGAGMKAGRLSLAGAPPSGTLKYVILLTDGNPMAWFNEPRRSPHSFPCGDPYIMSPSPPWHLNSMVATAWDPITLLPTAWAPDPSSGNAAYETVRRKMFLHAINEADIARNDGITVYSVGLGDLDMHAENGPYQTATSAADLHGIKKFFMERIANDQAQMQAPHPLPASTPPPAAYNYDFPQPGSTCVAPGATITDKPQGLFLLASNPATLNDIYRFLARIIRSRYAA